MTFQVTNPLWIAWWNARLCPGKGKLAPENDLVEEASKIAHQLIENDRVDLLALGEVAPEIAAILCPLGSPTRAFKTVYPNSPDKENIKVSVIYNSNRLDLVDHSIHRLTAHGKTKNLGIYIKFKTIGYKDYLHLFAIHWPSRRYDQDGSTRFQCASALRNAIDQIATDEATIVMGDFNDEPYNDSVYKVLRSSRDRDLVRIRPGLLYNPFWRLMGERQSLCDEQDLRLGAGSHFYASGDLTRWHTLDQILVSSILLGDSNWVLAEEEVGIWQAAPLLTDLGRIGGGFDHFPVIAAIGRKT